MMLMLLVDMPPSTSSKMTSPASAVPCLKQRTNPDLQKKRRWGVAAMEMLPNQGLQNMSMSLLSIRRDSVYSRSACGMPS